MALTLLLFAAVAEFCLPSSRSSSPCSLRTSGRRRSPWPSPVSDHRAGGGAGRLNAQTSAVLAGVETVSEWPGEAGDHPGNRGGHVAVGHGHISMADVAAAIYGGLRLKTLPSPPRCKSADRGGGLVSTSTGEMPSCRAVRCPCHRIADDQFDHDHRPVDDHDAGPGRRSTLSYGNRVVSAAAGLAALAVGTAVAVFLKMVAADDHAALRKSVTTFVVLLLVVTTPVAIALIVFAAPVIRLLFQRGQFTAADTLAVARVQQYGRWRSPFTRPGFRW